MSTLWLDKPDGAGHWHERFPDGSTCITEIFETLDDGVHERCWDGSVYPMQPDSKWQRVAPPREERPERSGLANGVIQLRSGALFSVLDPDPAAITLLDVAVSLARQPRYTGHTRRWYRVRESNKNGCLTCLGGEFFRKDAPGQEPSENSYATGKEFVLCGQCGVEPEQGYSVAEHSVWVSRIVAPGHEREALLHDAAEAFISDVVSPIKYLPGLERLVELERGVERAVAERFGLAYPWSPEVKAADQEMLCAEVRQLMPWRQAPEAWGDLPTRPISPAAEHARLGLPYREALALFLRRAAELGVS